MPSVRRHLPNGIALPSRVAPLRHNITPRQPARRLTARRKDQQTMTYEPGAHEC